MNAMRRIPSVLSALLLAALGVLATPPRAGGGTPVAGPVTWTDSRGDTGTVRFQGVVEGTALRGIVRFEGTEIPLRATLSENGRLDGSLFRPDGSTAGTVTGQVDGSGQIVSGTVNLDGALGTWAAPANALPSIP
jgi:hypothetical protein